MIQITPSLSISEDEISIEFTRASGPGGQHVNRVATAVQLRFNVANSPSLPDDVRQRLTKLAGSRLTKDGILVIDSRDTRSQLRNRQNAIDRLVLLIREATKRPKKRHKTKPSRAAKERRLTAKKRHSQRKRQRGNRDWE